MVSFHPAASQKTLQHIATPKNTQGVFLACCFTKSTATYVKLALRMHMVSFYPATSQKRLQNVAISMNTY